MLTEKAKQDLLNLHNEVLASGDIEKFDLFWNTLIFAGCDEEFESFKDSLEEEKRNTEILHKFEDLFKSGGQYDIIESKHVYESGISKWILYVKTKGDKHDIYYTVAIYNGCDCSVLARNGIKTAPF